MDIGKVFTDSIIIGPRHRPMDASRIEALAESINELGLQQPISVHMDDEDRVHLIAGLHRLEAARKLGWEQIEASFVTLSPIKREMWEIAENLFRVDLSKEQRDEHIRRYAELIEAAEADDVQSRHSVAIESKREDGRGHRPKGTARKVAEETGISIRTVQRVLSPEKPKPVPPPQAPHDPVDAYNKWAGEMNRVFSRAPQEWRDRWLNHADQAVFDRGAA
jgi:ParB family chromosome partitioning protein